MEVTGTWKLLMLFCFTGAVTKAMEIVTFPQNRHVLLGDNVTLTIGLSETVDKLFVPIYFFHENTIISSDSNPIDPSRHEVHVGHGNTSYQLTVLKAREGDASANAFDRCLVMDLKQAHLFLVTVLEGDTQCELQHNGNFTDLVAGERVELTCRLRYWGQWPPHMSLLGSNGPAIVTNLSNVGGLVEFKCQWVAAVSDQDAVVSVLTRFIDPPLNLIPNNSIIGSVNQLYSRNIPDYTHTYRGQPINVWSPASIIRITPHVDEHLVGDSIRCNASGNPEPALRWLDGTSDQLLGTGADLRLTQAMVGVLNVTCEASNTIRGNERSSIKSLRLIVRGNSAVAAFPSTAALLVAVCFSAFMHR